MVQKAHTSDVVVTLPCLTLYFPQPNQQLALIKITTSSGSRLTLSYENQVLLSSSQSLTRGVVGRVLGPTTSGDGGSLSYPGIDFRLNTPHGGSSRDDHVESLTVLPEDEDRLPEITPLRSVTIQVSPDRRCRIKLGRMG